MISREIGHLNENVNQVLICESCVLDVEEQPVDNTEDHPNDEETDKNHPAKNDDEDKNQDDYEEVCDMQHQNI